MGLQGRLLGHLAPQWAAQAASTRARIGRRTMPAPSSGASWLAAPRPHTTALFGGLASSRRKVSVVRLMRPPTSTPKTEDDQPAAPGLPEFRVSPAFAVDCLCQGEARLLVSPRTRLAIPTDRAHDGCVHGDLCALP